MANMSFSPDLPLRDERNASGDCRWIGVAVTGLKQKDLKGEIGRGYCLNGVSVNSGICVVRELIYFSNGLGFPRNQCQLTECLPWPASCSDSLMTDILILYGPMSEVSVFADILVDLVNRGLVFGVNNPWSWLFFPANGDEGKAEVLLLFLRPAVTLSSCISLFPLRFRVVTLPPPPLGETFRRDRVVIPV